MIEGEKFNFTFDKSFKSKQIMYFFAISKGEIYSLYAKNDQKTISLLQFKRNSKGIQKPIYIFFKNKKCFCS